MGEQGEKVEVGVLSGRIRAKPVAVEFQSDPQQGRPLVERLGPMDQWVLNTYAACDLACSYCITRAQGRSIPRVPVERMQSEVHRQLDAVGSPDRIVVGTFVDAYPSVEAEIGATRAAMLALTERGQDFTLITKGTTCLRDIDVFLDVDAHVQISIPFVDEETRREWEPHTPTIEDRLGAVRDLRECGVRVWVQGAPWIPGVSDVRRLRELVPLPTSVSITPLRLPHHLWETPPGRRFDQAEINAAYREEYERCRDLPRVRWSRPPALDGAPPHISDQFGRHEVTDWTPAPIAPDPGRDYLREFGEIRRERRRPR